MLAKEIAGEAYSKAEHNRWLQKLVGRTRGSIERKHQNISAVLIELGAPYVSGYKPLGHAQNLLKEVVQSRWAVSTGLHRTLNAVVESATFALPAIDDVLAIKVAAPVREPRNYVAREAISVPIPPVQRNYLEVEMRNRSIGRAGEELALRYEHERLWRAGKKDLANRIEHVAQSKGDGLGYDILSFETTGRERLIEVKTTNFGALTPFFVSRNEVEVSVVKAANYSLYRLFSFKRKPRLFTLEGALPQSCMLEPYQYRASLA